MRTITDRIDRVTGIREEQRSVTPPCPRSVKVELTGRCNLRCSFCATSENLRPKGDMDWAFYSDRLLPMLRDAGVEELGVFFLGESMTLPWLPRAVARAKEAGFSYVFLTTNGVLATPEHVKACMDAGLNSLKFSLNYANAEQFAAITRVKPEFFDRMIDNVVSASRVRDEGGYDCGVFASYIDYGPGQGALMKDLVDRLSPHLDEVYALPLYSQAGLTGRASTEAGWTVRAGNPGRAEKMRPAIPCWALFTSARVTWDGRLAACCFDHDQRFDMGDLTEQGLMEAWHGEGFQDLRRRHLAGEVAGTACAGCAAYG